MLKHIGLAVFPQSFIYKKSVGQIWLKDQSSRTSAIDAGSTSPARTTCPSSFLSTGCTSLLSVPQTKNLAVILESLALRPRVHCISKSVSTYQPPGPACSSSRPSPWQKYRDALLSSPGFALTPSSISSLRESERAPRNVYRTTPFLSPISRKQSFTRSGVCSTALDVSIAPQALALQPPSSTLPLAWLPFLLFL